MPLNLLGGLETLMSVTVGPVLGLDEVAGDCERSDLEDRCPGAPDFGFISSVGILSC